MNLKNYIHNREESGSITVFLSLILLLILSLLFTITEGARVSNAKVYAQRALLTATDSVLAEYYGPLWEEYHIFGLYTGEGSDTQQKEQIAAKLSDYMSYTFKPDKDLNITGDNNWELYNINLDSVSVDNTTRLMDYQGQLLINEAVEYMKYGEIGNGLELLLDKMSLLETPQKVSFIYEEKQKAEEELVEVDKGILELMELLDGLKTSKKGIEVSKDGALMTAEYFVKKICFTEVTKEAVGINHESVFQALRGSYVNPILEFNKIEANITNLEQIIEQIEGTQSEINMISGEISEVQNRLAQLNSIRKETEDNKQDIKEEGNAINSLQQAMMACIARISMLEDAKLTCKTEITASQNNISKLVTGIKPLISKAITKIDNIILKTETAAPFINQYASILNNSRELIGDETFTGLEEDLNEMKKYISVNDSGYDFSGMKKILENDLTVLTQVENLINQGGNELTQNNYRNAKASFTNAANIMSNYQTKGLTLDYSTLVIDKAAQNTPLSAINDIVQAGITGMIIDPDKISDSELNLNTLPSEVAILSEGDTDFLSKLTEFFKTAAGGSSPGTGDLFRNFGNGTDILSMASKGVNKLAEQLLYQEYIKEHFGMYSYQEDSSSCKPSALIYEQEYLLTGHLTDRDNLSSVVSRILFLRTILDFVSILGDSAKRNEARAAAAALVGFTGLPILVAITQVLILLAWSFAEALLDACALMMDKAVPVLKKRVVLEFPDLFMLNRQFLQKKAAAFTNSKELSLSYQDYLRMFLLLGVKKDLAYRSMDLMQEDIKVRYVDSTFDITKCLFGYETAIEYTIPSKFTGISYVQKYLNTDINGFRFTEQAANSY